MGPEATHPSHFGTLWAGFGRSGRCYPARCPLHSPLPPRTRCGVSRKEVGSRDEAGVEGSIRAAERAGARVRAGRGWAGKSDRLCPRCPPECAPFRCASQTCTSTALLPIARQSCRRNDCTGITLHKFLLGYKNGRGVHSTMPHRPRNYVLELCVAKYSDATCLRRLHSAGHESTWEHTRQGVRTAWKKNQI